MKACKTIVLSALLALTLPAAGAAQRGPRGPFGPGGAGSPMERWLELRDELALTAEQVSRLEAIGARLREQNASHLAHMQEVREELGLPELRWAERGERGARADGERKPRERMSEEDRARMRDFMDRTRDDMEAVRSNMRDAMEEARDVLTDEQRDRLRETMRSEMRWRRGERGERHERRPRGGAGGPGS
ncbi:MAG TPA: Spy/CpxP family protein refolding chaperone [Longimicrobiales bacterium]|nr:Spy/CpxP family protein refolding chaperone [Longimicrobiales bacterium]